MYGAFIGDIVGSKYEFNNIKTKDFPLFSAGCDFTDDSIMTAAVADAILRSREEMSSGNKSGKGFKDFLIESMRAFGRKYPHPTGAYGNRFAQWLRSNDPKPYGSFGNGSAMRVSPCGLAAVELKEAIALAEISAAVTHDHPEGIKGAKCVAAAVFLAKVGRSKEEIRQYVADNYYPLDFTLDSIRDSYRFDGSCQGSVPQALAAFFESTGFEDAIRNVISIGGDCDTTGAITGSLAWVYYAVQSGSYSGWCEDRFDPEMLRIREQAKAYLPQELLTLADTFHEVCWRRAGTHYRTGGFCAPILSDDERTRFVEKREKSYTDLISEKTEREIERFCARYLTLTDALYHDRELNAWCAQYAANGKNAVHKELERILYDRLVPEAYGLGFMHPVLKSRVGSPYAFDRLVRGSKLDQLHALAAEIRRDWHDPGYLLREAIAEGRLYRVMRALLQAFEQTDRALYARPDVYSHEETLYVDDAF